MEEIFLPVVGFEDLYEVSNKGRVYSLIRHKILKQELRCGYWYVNLKHNIPKRINRLVAEAFIPNPLNLPDVNHKDENKTNNFVYVNQDGTVDFEKSNLEWCDVSYNTKYGKSIENMLKSRKEKCSTNAETPILQYSLDGTLIKEWNSFAEIKRQLGFNIQNIHKVCQGKRKKAKNCIWKYKEVA